MCTFELLAVLGLLSECGGGPVRGHAGVLRIALDVCLVLHHLLCGAGDQFAAGSETVADRVASWLMVHCCRGWTVDRF